MIISHPTAYQGGARTLRDVPRRSGEKQIVTEVMTGDDTKSMHEAGVRMLKIMAHGSLQHTFSPSSDGVNCTACGGLLDELEVCGRCGTDHFALRTGK